MRVFSSQLSSLKGEHVTLLGSLILSRKLGKISFLVLKDLFGQFQVVIKDSLMLPKDYYVGSVFKVSGNVVESNSKSFPFEILTTSIETVVDCCFPPVIDYSKKSLDYDLDFLLSNRSLSLRHSSNLAIFDIQAQISYAYRAYMRSIFAKEFFGPCIVPSGTESGAEIFSIQYFDKKAFLAQSNQLYKQIMVGCFERVFGIIPFFRADPSHTTFHVSEGHQLEFEIGFVDVFELMDILEDLIRFIIKSIELDCKKSLDEIGVDLPHLPLGKIPTFTFANVCEMLSCEGVNDLGSLEEKNIANIAKEKFGSDFVFITHWPLSSRPFYSMPDGNGNTLTFDLICRGTEVCSGGIRRHTMDLLDEAFDQFNVDKSNLHFYIQTFEHGMPPHGGFGIGLERLTMKFLDLKNIRQALLFPSDCKRIASVSDKVFFGTEIKNEIVSLVKRSNQEVFICSEDDESILSKYESLCDLKSIILMGKVTKQFYQVALNVSSKIDMKKIHAITGEDCKLANPDIINKEFGLTVGSIPPFGKLMGIKSFLDSSCIKEEFICFNPGIPNESMIIPTKIFCRISYVKVVDLIIL